MIPAGTVSLPAASVLESQDKTNDHFLFVLDWVTADNIADDIQDHNSVSLKCSTI